MSLPTSAHSTGGRTTAAGPSAAKPNAPRGCCHHWWTIAAFAGGVFAMAAPRATAALTAVDAQRLTRDRATDMTASWSPDGKSLAFVSTREGSKNLWICTAATGDLHRATTFALPAFADQPTWSPTADEIAFTSNRADNGSPDIWLLNLETNEQSQLTTTPSVDWMPVFSPNGRQLAFVSDWGGKDALWVMNRDGSDPRKLVDDGWDPAWSPDGTKIAYRSFVTGQEGVAVVSVNGGEPVLIAPAASAPTWSPDGRRLCMVMRVDAQDELRLTNADGTAPVALPLRGQSPRSPDWSRDGSRIVYDAEGDGGRSLYVVSLDYRTPEVAIADPSPGDRLQGTIQIRGSVKIGYGELDHAVVEVGAGEGPTEWQQVGETLRQPVENDVLASWNLEGLTGAYTIRVTAVDAAGDAGVAQVQVHALSEHGVEFASADTPGTMTAGEVYSVPLSLKNVGTMTWLNSGRYEVKMGYRWLDDSGTVVIRKGLLAPLPRPVESGETVSLEAQIKAPPLPGRHTLEYDLRQGDLLWFSDRNALTRRVAVQVVVPISARLLGQQTPKQMTPGQEYAVALRLLNNGTGPWSAEGEPKIALGYHWLTEGGDPVDHTPALTQLTKTVLPDTEVSVSATVRAPEIAGKYLLRCDLLIGEERWLFGEKGDVPTATVTVQTLDGVSFSTAEVARSMAPGQIYVANVGLQNTGSLPWKAEGRACVRLGYHWLDAAGNTLQQEPILATLPYEVLSGKSLVLAAQVQSPATPGEYSLEWDLVKGEDQWFSTHGSRPYSQSVLVARPAYGVQFSAVDHPAKMIVGQPYLVTLTAKNLGTLTWSSREPHLIKLGYHWLDQAGNEIPHSPLLVPMPREVGFDQTVTLPGQVRAPEVAGQYTLKWDLLQEGRGWFSAEGANTLSTPVRVEVLYGVEFTSHDTPAFMMPSQRYTVHLRVKNLGVLKWEAQGDVPVQLSYRWQDQTGAAVVARGQLTNLPADVLSGANVDLQAQVQAPGAPGTYVLKWDLLQGGLLWFADKGAKPLEVVVVVGP